MKLRTTLGCILVASLLALTVGCAPSTPGDNGPADTRLAFGLHQRDDGTVDVVGKLERIELEGGFHALTGWPSEGDVIAVIANPEAFEADLRALLGTDVQVHGTPADGASIRMAGPEVVIDSIRSW